MPVDDDRVVDDCEGLIKGGGSMFRGMGKGLFWETGEEMLWEIGEGLFWGTGKEMLWKMGEGMLWEVGVGLFIGASSVADVVEGSLGSDKGTASAVPGESDDSFCSFRCCSWSILDSRFSCCT